MEEDNTEAGAGPQEREISAAELRKMRFEPIRWTVPGVLAEGVTLFAGNPKVGKSWLALDVGIAVARGGFTLGEKKCQQGVVLYLALEDNRRRLQRRLDKLLGTADWPAGLRFYTEWARLDAGALDRIRNWIERVENPRLVIIDTLAMIRVSRGDRQSLYESDYAAIQGLREIASDTGVAILVVHHTRKQAADTDVFERVSGSFGLSGAADAVLILDRDGQGVTLHGRGRDVEEIEQAVEFNRTTCRWRILGTAAEVRRTDERKAILAELRQATEPMTPAEIADAIGKSRANVKVLLGKMVKSGEVIKPKKGLYRVPDGNRSDAPVTTPVTTNDEAAEGEVTADPHPQVTPVTPVTKAEKPNRSKEFDGNRAGNRNGNRPDERLPSSAKTNEEVIPVTEVMQGESVSPSAASAVFLSARDLVPASFIDPRPVLLVMNERINPAGVVVCAECGKAGVDPLLRVFTPDGPIEGVRLHDACIDKWEKRSVPSAAPVDDDPRPNEWWSTADEWQAWFDRHPDQLGKVH